MHFLLIGSNDEGDCNKTDGKRERHSKNNKPKATSV